MAAPPKASAPPPPENRNELRIRTSADPGPKSDGRLQVYLHGGLGNNVDNQKHIVTGRQARDPAAVFQGAIMKI
jgi:hypothetical protein